ncbi:MAG: hypothetical protein K9G58_06990 [Bacteroidales bacterium]|nr:hypothetical protein [Bacteroidales bacterium]MCF8386406.1 hypothetical protein [Bacteroidales bacterium]MCF8397896.1 hypothetical protein [Bacteroidales bacterium]
MEKTLQKVDPDDLPIFRKTLNTLIRPLSKGPGEILSPDMGWAKMKSECSKDEINYSGASGNCDIDTEGNASTAYALFAVEKSGEKFYFKILKIIP